MVGDTLRFFSLAVWSLALLAFVPGAIKAARGDHSPLALVSLPACFSFANRIMFNVTLLFAPSLAIVSQVTGIMAGAWLAYVGMKVVWHGR